MTSTKYFLIFTSYFLLLTSYFLGCAKKAPPPSPDRWAPKLTKVNAIDNTHIRLYFTERLDENSVKNIANYSIRDWKVPPTILEVYSSALKNQDIFLAVAKMEPIEYTIIVKGVKDISLNLMKETQKRFTGSIIPDTTAPVILLKPPAILTNVKQDTFFTVKFSEPIKKFESLILPTSHFSLPTSYLSWDSSYTSLTISPKILDTSLFYSFYARAYDADSNSVFFTFSFTGKEKLPELIIEGETEKSALILVFKDKIPIKVAVSDIQGVYSLKHLDKGDYILKVFKDSNIFEQSIELIVSRQDVDIFSPGSIDSTFIPLLETIQIIFPSESRLYYHKK